MKRRALLTIIAMVAALLCSTAAFAQKEKDKDKLKDKGLEFGELMERQIAASQNVLVSLCISTGDVQVQGWDRPEVKVTATSLRQLELQSGGTSPSQRVEVLASNRTADATGEGPVSQCRAVTDMTINVPRGATVEIKLRSGDIEVIGVAEARAENMSGDITVSNVTRAVEARSLSGDVTLDNSTGRVSLRSISGDVDATNIRPVEAGDDFSAHSTSGDISLESVAQARLSANSTSGMITLTGALARRGNYNLNTISGDVVLNIPQDSAFRISAKSPQGAITTDFAIKSATDTDSQNLLQSGTLTGTYGASEWATLSVNSFSGTVRLQKR